MGLIKGVLKEELQNSLRLKKRYEETILKYPAGSIVVKNINGRKYNYVARRVGAKVLFEYKGKVLAKDFLSKFERSKRLRLKYKEMIRRLNKRVKYLRRAVSGKENV